MARAKQPVSINDIEFDALIEENLTLEATVPEYSVESGYSVSDAIILSPEKLNMVLFVTDTPVTWHKRHGSERGRTEAIVKRLQEMYYKSTPVTVTTSDKTYTDMAIESISFSKTVEIGYAREIPISFKKIRITKAQTTTIPDSYGKSGITGEQSGTANTTTAQSESNDKDDNGKKSSILYNIGKSIGLIK